MARNPELANKLSCKIKDNNILQTDLARLVVITSNQLSRIIRGLQPSPATLQKINDALLPKGIASADSAEFWKVTLFPSPYSGGDFQYSQLKDISRMLSKVDDEGWVEDMLDDLMLVTKVNISLFRRGPLLRDRTWESTIKLLSESEKQFRLINSLYNELYDKHAYANYSSGKYTHAIQYYKLALLSL